MAVDSVWHSILCNNSGLSILLHGTPQNGYLGSENPDEMQHYATFHQGLLCLQRQNLSSVKKIQFFFIVICEPLINTMDHPDLILCKFMEHTRAVLFVRAVKTVFIIITLP